MDDGFNRKNSNSKNIQAKQFQPKSQLPQAKVKGKPPVEVKTAHNLHNVAHQNQVKESPKPKKKVGSSGDKVLTPTVKKEEISNKNPDSFKGVTFKKQQKEAEGTALKKQTNSQVISP